MTFLLTGGYGFIGAWVARDLLAAGHTVVSYDLKDDARRLRLILSDAEVARVRFAPGDVTDAAGLARALDEHAVTHVIHLAGLQVPACRANPVLGGAVNVLGTLAVFEAVKAAKVRPARVVYASSAAVFGAPELYPPGPKPDSGPLIPSSHYGVFKVCNEGNARIYFQDHGVTSVGLRPWTVYGPGRDLGVTSDPTKAIKAALLGRPFTIQFGGVTDFQYVGDTARAFVLAATRPFEGAGAFNLRGEVRPVAEFCAALAEVVPAARHLIAHKENQIAIAYDLSDGGIAAALGPMPKTSLKDGIAQTVAVFERLRAGGRLDASELDVAPVPAPTVAAIDEV